MDSLDIASRNPDKDVVFFALGFETTMPSTALTIQEAKKREVLNFSILCNHITIPQTLKALLDTDNLNLDAFIGVSLFMRLRVDCCFARGYHNDQRLDSSVRKLDLAITV